jgi:hypothetical protein
MPLPTQVKKITKSKPFYALAGAGDYVAAKFNEFYDDLVVRGREIVSELSREAAYELEDVSQTAEPAIAPEAVAPRKGSTRGTTTISPRGGTL